MTGYAAIEDHGAIGNLRTVGLVACDGTLDWLCLPHLDSPSVFAALLDVRRGGRFRVGPPGDPRKGAQRYLEDTNVLETVFDGPGGRLVVSDLLPLDGSLDEPTESEPEPAVYRLVHAEGGEVEADVAWAPRFGYAEQVPEVARTEHGWLAWDGDRALSLAGVGDEARIEDEGNGWVLRARLRLEGGQRRALVTRWGAEVPVADAEEAHRRRDATVEAWRDWVHKAAATGARDWAKPHEGLVVRSELVLKLLTHADTGAIAAAATTSLPEEIGGVRNWDYRFTWIRDAGLAAQAMFALGHRAEADAFINFAERVARETGDRGRSLQILHGLHGETDLEEHELPGLEGYRRSAPVRIGNGAAGQLQLDIYGELISAAYEVLRLGGRLDRDVLDFLPEIADQACAAWQQPDYGLWELRNGPFNFVYSKVMVWMGLERAERLVARGDIQGDVEGWRTTRRAIAEEVLEQGFDPQLGAFKQSYERSVLDASNLLLAMQEFLPFDDPRVRQNLESTLESLTDQGLVFRYKADDGVAGGEGAFNLCTFWLVDALALSGRLDEAEQVLATMARSSNHLGLFSEQLDPSSGAFLGNFPQAFSHIGLINSSLYVAHAKGRELPIPSLIGSEEHRTAD